MTRSADLTRTDEHWIPVIGGQVACPRLGVVELDRCRECTYLVRVAAAGPDRLEVTDVVCLGATVGESDPNDWGC